MQNTNKTYVINHCIYFLIAPEFFFLRESLGQFHTLKINILHYATIFHLLKQVTIEQRIKKRIFLQKTDFILSTSKIYQSSATK